MQSYRNEPPVLLADLNEYITCKLCKGYLIDAVSITECLHPFCKSCIVKYLNERYDCPSCGILIHQSHPLNYISFDRTLQDIVYKVVPDLRKKEKLLRESFYRIMGKSPPASEGELQSLRWSFSNASRSVYINYLYDSSTYTILIKTVIKT
ncbi:Polycomb group ring finger 1 [Paragonimus heterotremus]|uniref:Polycomb group ring finger 1 n=1 Tax=Paragonimus heterotremus TaxID=100268 RepID=A0A8J4SR95_9TREM|nr:Polycomb group ring finger 1 [Paragonimus heterotremus]